MPRGKACELYTKGEKLKLNEIKHVLCVAIKNSERNFQIKPSHNLARHIGTNLSRLSEVHTLQYDKLTLNQLFHYLIRLNPNFQVQIVYKYYSSAELALEYSNFSSQ